MFKVPALILLLLSSLSLCSCGDSPNAPLQEELLLELNGTIEYLGGDCSAVQVRTRSLGNFDLNGFQKLRIDLDSYSDADLSSIVVYYVNDGEQVNLLSLGDRELINTTKRTETGPVRFSGEIFARVTLKSSVCTGQIFFLRFADLKLTGLK